MLCRSTILSTFSPFPLIASAGRSSSETSFVFHSMPPPSHHRWSKESSSCSHINRSTPSIDSSDSSKVDHCRTLPPSSASSPSTGSPSFICSQAADDDFEEDEWNELDDALAASRHPYAVSSSICVASTQIHRPQVKRSRLCRSPPSLLTLSSTSSSSCRSPSRPSVRRRIKEWRRYPTSTHGAIWDADWHKQWATDTDDSSSSSSGTIEHSTNPPLHSEALSSFSSFSSFSSVAPSSHSSTTSTLPSSPPSTPSPSVPLSSSSHKKRRLSSKRRHSIKKTAIIHTNSNPPTASHPSYAPPSIKRTIKDFFK